MLSLNMRIWIMINYNPKNHLLINRDTICKLIHELKYLETLSNTYMPEIAQKHHWCIVSDFEVVTHNSLVLFLPNQSPSSYTSSIVHPCPCFITVTPSPSSSITKNRALQVDFSRPFHPSIAQVKHCISFLGTWGS